jgi:hypothetical protein
MGWRADIVANDLAELGPVVIHTNDVGADALTGGVTVAFTARASNRGRAVVAVSVDSIGLGQRLLCGIE